MSARKLLNGIFFEIRYSRYLTYLGSLVNSGTIRSTKPNLEAEGQPYGYVGIKLCTCSDRDNKNNCVFSLCWLEDRANALYHL